MVAPTDLSLRHLDVCVAVAREGSISAAAAAVNMSQPALTQALAKLERLLGRRLFDRQSSGTTATESGTLFAIRAARALAYFVEGGRRLRRSTRSKPIAHLERIATMSELRALAAVSRAGSYALAAREIGLSQPSVHRAVKDLELILGADLLVRSGRNVLPTPRAARLIGAIRLMMNELQAGIDELAAMEHAGAGRIIVGALPLPRAGLLPEALSLFTRAYSAAEVTIVEGPYSDLLSGLRGGEIDMMLGDLRDPAPTPDIIQTPLFSDSFHIVARAGHPLVGSTMPDAEALVEYPWIVGNRGAPMRAMWESLFPLRRPAQHIDCGSVLTARGLLVEGDWLALMSPDQFRIEQQAGLLATVGGPIAGVRRRIGVTTRADWRPTAAQAALLEALTSAGARRSSGN